MGQQGVERAASARARRGGVLLRACASLALTAIPASGTATPLPGGFQGHLIGATPSVTRIATSQTSETITVGSHTATLDWLPFDQHQGGGTIDFLPAGNVVTFTSAPGIIDYTVLNRIVPADATRPISLNGQLISTLQGTHAIGGRIWFFSPGGIVVGATAVFDVGSLLLTTSHVSDLSWGFHGFSATFTSPASSAAKIQILDGAQINALQPGSYVAMVAPRIEQGGIVRVNGSAAYAAGEQVTMTLDQGLFDIQVDVGTTDANGIVHTGETSGPANSTAGDNHSIYMVAVPKNQALTMLLGGNVGFDAANAEVQNGQVILTSGGDIEFTGGSVSSSLTASATLNPNGSILVDGNLGFINASSGDSVTLNAARKIEVNTDTGSIMMLDSGNQLAGTLNLNAANVWVAQQSILSQLETDSNYSGRDAALALNSDTSNLNGYVGADTVAIAVSSSLFGQNSGTTTDMAGISAGAGGFSIASTGATPATVNVYGRQTANGTTVAGIDFFKAAALSGSFASGSMINGCVIGTSCAPPPPPPSAAPPHIPRDEVVPWLGTDQANDGDDDDDQDIIDLSELSGTEDVSAGVTSGSDTSEWDPGSEGRADSCVPDNDGKQPSDPGALAVCQAPQNSPATR